jgi:hypothetical protein
VSATRRFIAGLGYVDERAAAQHPMRVTLVMESPTVPANSARWTKVNGVPVLLVHDFEEYEVHEHVEHVRHSCYARARAIVRGEP